MSELKIKNFFISQSHAADFISKIQDKMKCNIVVTDDSIIIDDTDKKKGSTKTSACDKIETNCNSKDSETNLECVMENGHNKIENIGCFLLCDQNTIIKTPVYNVPEISINILV